MNLSVAFLVGCLVDDLSGLTKSQGGNGMSSEPTERDDQMRDEVFKLWDAKPQMGKDTTTKCLADVNAQIRISKAAIAKNHSLIQANRERATKFDEISARLAAITRQLEADTARVRAQTARNLQAQQRPAPRPRQRRRKNHHTRVWVRIPFLGGISF